MSKGGRGRKRPPPFILDTHIWFWHVMGSSRLPPSLRDAIDGAHGQVWLSPISVWELGILHERGRVRLKSTLRAWVEDARKRFPLREAPTNREVALRSAELTLPSHDPADRFLAATALTYELTLVTLDERLVAASSIPTRSG